MYWTCFLTTCTRSRPFRVPCLLALLPAVALGGGGGELVTVSTLEDVVDFGGARQVSDLPGPDGEISFREACLAATNTPGPQTIAFAIPTSEYWLLTDRALLKCEDGVFFIGDDETTIDFTTQTAFAGDTNPNGWEVGGYGLEANGWGAPFIAIGADFCTVIGLDRVMQRGQAVAISGNNNRVINCTISGPLHSGVEIGGGFGGPPASGNVIGGVAPDEGNVLSSGGAGVRIEAPAENNVVIGNRISGGDIGVWLIGSIYSTTVNNNRIGGPSPEERNVIAGGGGFCCEGFPDGTQVQVEHGVGNVIEGNYIGLDWDGVTPISAIASTAIEVLYSPETVIRGNVIANTIANGANHYAGQRFGTAIELWGGSDGALITGNRIGTDASGAVAIPNRTGIVFSGLMGGASDALVEDNLVAFNETTGIAVHAGSSGVEITRNAIFENGALGIDLFGAAGVTPNDSGDGDAGGNDLQNFPVLESAEAGAASTTISGTLQSTPGSLFRIEFFASESCDPSGHGEGALFLGDTTVTTDPAGNASFQVSLAAPSTPGEVATATAISAQGDTSEFSACVVITGRGGGGDVDGDGDVDITDLGLLLQAYGTCEGAPGYISGADFSGNGCIEISDLGILLANYGA